MLYWNLEGPDNVGNVDLRGLEPKRHQRAFSPFGSWYASLLEKNRRLSQIAWCNEHPLSTPDECQFSLIVYNQGWNAQGAPNPLTILSVTYPGIICRRLIGPSKQTEAVCAQTLNSFFQSGRSQSAPSSLHHCRHEIPSLCPEQAWTAPLCFSLTGIWRLEKPFSDIQTNLKRLFCSRLCVRGLYWDKLLENIDTRFNPAAIIARL